MTDWVYILRQYTSILLSIISTIFIIYMGWVGYIKYIGGHVDSDWIIIIVNVLISVALYLISACIYPIPKHK